MTAERNDIKQKRAKVKDTCADIGAHMKRMEKDKKMMLEAMNSANSTPRKRSNSRLSDSNESESLR